MKLQTKSLSQEEETGRTHHIFPDLEEQAALAALLKRKNAKNILTWKGQGKKTAKNNLEPVAETDAKTHNHEQKKKQGENKEAQGTCDTAKGAMAAPVFPPRAQKEGDEVPTFASTDFLRTCTHFGEPSENVFFWSCSHGSPMIHCWLTHQTLH
jgi:hypothetical protein